MDWIIGCIVFVVLTILAIFMLKYLNGGFSYVDTVESQRRYEVTKTNQFGFGSPSVDFIIRVVIRRHYSNGRIKFITREIKA